MVRRGIPLTSLQVEKGRGVACNPFQNSLRAPGALCVHQPAVIAAIRSGTRHTLPE